MSGKSVPGLCGRKLLAVLFCICGISATLSAADELDVLLREVKPPARFSNRRPRLHVKDVIFRSPAGDKAQTKQAIFDGERMVGYLRGPNSTLWGQVRLFSMHPDHRASVDPANWADATHFRSSVLDYGDELTLVSSRGNSDVTRTEVRGGGPGSTTSASSSCPRQGATRAASSAEAATA